MTGRPEGEHVADLIAAAEPSGPQPLGDLVARLGAADLVRGARRDDLPVGAAGLTDVEVRGITDDSKAVRPGSLFVAVPGFHVDGHDFVAGAARAGAAAAIVEHPVAGAPLPQLVVSSARAALARSAAWWYGDPSRALGTIGITGTDGKTTTSFLAVAALEAAGLSAGLIGTVETKVGRVRERHAAHVDDPRRARAAGDHRGDGPRRQPGGRPRDDVARARARPRARGCLGRRGVHQPHPRAPRAPRHVRGVPGGQAAAVQGSRRRW